MKRSSLTKHATLHWIGACLHANITRKKVWYFSLNATNTESVLFVYLAFISTFTHNNYYCEVQGRIEIFCFTSFFLQMMAEFFAASQAHDGFFLNLSMSLLKLCQPFMDPSSSKLLKINPKYCAVTVDSNMMAHEKSGAHVLDLASETRLVVPPDEEHITFKSTPEFGFVTECFFMTHHCLHLGTWVVCTVGLSRQWYIQTKW